MARKKKKTDDTYTIFKRGVTLADGTRFEAGTDVPDNLSSEELSALLAVDAFFIPGEPITDAVLDAEEVE